MELVAFIALVIYFPYAALALVAIMAALLAFENLF